MKNIFKIIVLVFVASTMFAQQEEELEVKGNVLFKDQVKQTICIPVIQVSHFTPLNPSSYLFSCSYLTHRWAK